MAERRTVHVPGSVERALDVALDKALAIQRPAVLAYLDRARARRAGATPAQLIGQLERRYRVAVVGIGAACGGVAAVQGVGTASSIAAGAAEITAFVSATALYVLAVAEIHGVPVSDPEVRRALVLAALVGEGAVTAIGAATDDGAHWAHVIGRSSSREKIMGMNGRLAHLLVTRFGARQSALLLGRALPMGIGAGIGAAGNAALARSAIRAAGRAFGPAPRIFAPRIVDVSPARPELR
jgi:hypothetical protein